MQDPIGPICLTGDQMESARGGFMVPFIVINAIWFVIGTPYANSAE